jgi:integrase
MEVRADISFAEALQKYVDQRWSESERRNNRGYHTVNSRLRAFVRDMKCADLRLKDLTVEQAAEIIQNYLDAEHQRGIGATTLDNVRRDLSRLYSFIIRSRFVPFRENPCFAATGLLCLPKREIRCKRPLSDLEVQTLLWGARDTPIYWNLVLAVGCGLRMIGTCRVKPADVDFDARTVRVMEKKRERIIPLGTWAAGELRDWLASHEWRKVDTAKIIKIVATIREEANLAADVTCQALRRTAVKKLWENGVSPQLAARIMGHSVEIAQRHYLQLETLNARDEVNFLDFGPKAKPSALPAKPKPSTVPDKDLPGHALDQRNEQRSRRDKVLELHKRGQSVTMIATVLRVASWTVRQDLKALGVEPNIGKSGRPKATVPSETVEPDRETIMAGVTTVPPGTVQPDRITRNTEPLAPMGSDALPVIEGVPNGTPDAKSVI